MSNNYEKVCSDIEKTEKKITELQAKLKDLREKKVELENLEIVNTVRAMVMDKDEIMAFLKTMKPVKPSASTTNNDSMKTEVSENE